MGAAVLLSLRPRSVKNKTLVWSPFLSATGPSSHFAFRACNKKILVELKVIKKTNSAEKQCFGADCWRQPSRTDQLAQPMWQRDVAVDKPVTINHLAVGISLWPSGEHACVSCNLRLWHSKPDWALCAMPQKYLLLLIPNCANSS